MLAIVAFVYLFVMQVTKDDTSALGVGIKFRTF